MDMDIQFGDLEESAPRSELRPDQNKHYAVASVGEPDPSDLPIYVDLDVMLDMEEHALTDTDVELGGVMLGGQYEDDERRPFVVVTDSLRAKHYESTKGSFKFTHDTWSEITREREEFPEELQMVGWYHTHPDWGVFLSGMDMFICDNFFNKTLDVALVIDPCRNDRGMFQWTGEAGQRIRRTGGFYLTSSRFRGEELEFIAAQLSGEYLMNDPRFRSMGMSSAPVVNIADRNSWQGLAVMGMLALQFLVLLMIAARLLLPAGDTASADKRMQGLEKQVAGLTLAERNTLRMQAQAEVLDALLKRMEGGPEAKFTKAVEAEQKAKLWQNAAVGQYALSIQLEQKLKDAQSDLSVAVKASESLEKQLAAATLAKKNLEKERNALKQSADEKEDGGLKWLGVDWKVWTFCGVLVALLIAGGVMSSIGGRGEERYAGEPARPDEIEIADSSPPQEPDFEEEA